MSEIQKVRDQVAVMIHELRKGFGDLVDAKLIASCIANKVLHGDFDEAYLVSAAIIAAEIYDGGRGKMCQEILEISVEATDMVATLRGW